jgi:hypothetical protein
MNIKGLDYNTQRQGLLMPEYGREIQKMVDYAVSLPDREQRLKCAKTIVKLMETKIPSIRENSGYQQTLWDHLYLMSGKQLDIDWPYDVGNAERILQKPQPMPRPEGRIALRHYGRLVEQLVERLKSMPAGPERDELTKHTANQMKRDLVLWGHGSIDNEKVADDLARLTGGVIQLNMNTFRFEKFVPASEMPQKNSGKKKKKG